MNLKKFNNYYLYLAIIFIGLVLRLYYSSLESYWFDEQISFYISDLNSNIDWVVFKLVSYNEISNSFSLTTREIKKSNEFFREDL